MKTVLICDDSTTDLTRLSTVLETNGCFIIKSTQGKKVLELAQRHHPDVIFLDIIMPDKDGFVVCRELVSNNDTKDIPIIFVSSKGKKADHIWAKMQGAKALVQKPFNDSDILEKLALV